jgi:hypothetical protein
MVAEGDIAVKSRSTALARTLPVMKTALFPLLAALTLAGCPAPVASVDAGSGDAFVPGTDGGSPGTDGGSPGTDGGTDAAASASCSPAGTYDMVWTADPTNSAGCTAPAGTLDTGADGIPRSSTGSPTTCPPGCGAPECVITGVNATCASDVSLMSPCGAITDSASVVIHIAYDGDTATVMAALMQPDQTCHYSGVGTRR